MKKNIILAIAVVMLVSGCGTYTGAGAYTGSMIGSILGSAIGGISGGPRGSDLGTIVGMAGGAAVGAAVGSAADKQKTSAYQRRTQSYDNQQYQQQQYDNSGYDATGSGDDRIYMDNSTSSSYSTAPSYGTDLEIRNMQFVAANQNGTITPSTENKIVFEVVNNTNNTIYDVRPMVRETTGNRHIFISPDARVESIPAKGAVRYTAIVKSDRSLKNGNVNFSVKVGQGSSSSVIDSKDIAVYTQK